MSEKHSLRNALIDRFARFVTGRPVLTLAICGTIAALSIVYTALNLEYHSDRSALVDSEVDWQKRYAAYKERFPRWDDLIVAVDLRGASQPAGVSFMVALRERLEEDDLFRDATIGYDTNSVRADALFSRPYEQVEQAVESIRASSPVLAAQDVAALVRFSDFLGTTLNDAQQQSLASLLDRANKIARGAEGSLLNEQDGGPELLTTGTGNIAFALVSLSDKNALGDSIASLRAHIAALLERPEHAGLEAGVTGVPVLESDETEQSTKDATFASILSLSLIAMLMMIVYRRIEVPLIAILALLLGVGASFGWVTLVVGHLQVLSVVFAVVLLGLGIDTAIHFIARLELVHADHEHMAAGLRRTFRGVGPGVLTGALTTAAAFGATAFTEFTGVAEMGLIASGGVIICTLFIVAVFPALLVLLPKPEKRIRDRGGGESRPFMGRLGIAMDTHHKFVLAGSVLIVGLCAWLATGVRYDPDLIKLMPVNAESVQWERRISSDDAQSVWNAVVIAEGEADAQRIIDRFRSVPEVAGVGGAAELLDGGPDLARKLALARTLPSVSSTAPSKAENVSQQFRDSLIALSARWSGTNDRISQLGSSLAELDDASLQRVVQAYAHDRDSLITRIRVLRASSGPTIESIPVELRELLIASTSEDADQPGILLRVYPHEPREGTTVLSPENLEPFAEAVLRVEPGATGPTVQIYESADLIQRSYANAALYALLAIALLLCIDFRSLADALCALVPVLGGTAMLLAIMALLDEPLNFANTIVMPLIAGLGVDSGVHAVHRWRAQPQHKPAGLAGGTGRAIGITTLTTIIGFACMMTAEHRGIRSLGLVMSLGLGTTWLSAVTLLPSILRMRTSRSVRMLESSGSA